MSQPLDIPILTFSSRTHVYRCQNKFPVHPPNFTEHFSPSTLHYYFCTWSSTSGGEFPEYPGWHFANGRFWINDQTEERLLECKWLKDTWSGTLWIDEVRKGKRKNSSFKFLIFHLPKKLRQLSINMCVRTHTTTAGVTGMHSSGDFNTSPRCLCNQWSCKPIYFFSVFYQYC